MRRYEYIFFQRGHTDGQKTQEKMLTITNYSGNASQNQSEMSPHTCCCCSVTQSCLTLCNPMNCSTPGFPVLHYLWSLLMSIESGMPSNHLILCHPLLLPSIFYSKPLQHFYQGTRVIKRAILINVRLEQARDCKGSSRVIVFGKQSKEESKKQQ